MKARVFHIGLALLAFSMSAAGAQQIDLGAGSTTSVKRQHVELLSDKLSVEGGKPQDVEVSFRVDPGFHINSHHPKDELLIPTLLKLEDVSGIRILSQQYPSGAAFKIAVGGESEILDVYTGEFRVGLRVIAPHGVKTMRGLLHYQACDNAACFPPRDLPVTLTLTAR